MNIQKLTVVVATTLLFSCGKSPDPLESGIQDFLKFSNHTLITENGKSGPSGEIQFEDENLIVVIKRDILDGEVKTTLSAIRKFDDKQPIVIGFDEFGKFKSTENTINSPSSPSDGE